MRRARGVVPDPGCDGSSQHGAGSRESDRLHRQCGCDSSCYAIEHNSQRSATARWRPGSRRRRRLPTVARASSAASWPATTKKQSPDQRDDNTPRLHQRAGLRSGQTDYLPNSNMAGAAHLSTLPTGWLVSAGVTVTVNAVTAVPGFNGGAGYSLLDVTLSTTSLAADGFTLICITPKPFSLASRGAERQFNVMSESCRRVSLTQVAQRAPTDGRVQRFHLSSARRRDIFSHSQLLRRSEVCSGLLLQEMAYADTFKFILLIMVSRTGLYACLSRCLRLRTPTGFRGL